MAAWQSQAMLVALVVAAVAVVWELIKDRSSSMDDDVARNGDPDLTDEERAAAADFFDRRQFGEWQVPQPVDNDDQQ